MLLKHIYKIFILKIYLYIVIVFDNLINLHLSEYSDYVWNSDVDLVNVVNIYEIIWKLKD